MTEMNLPIAALEGYVLKLDHETKSPSLGWNIRGVMECDCTGMTLGDVLKLASRSIKIDWQRPSRTMQREAAVKHLNRRAHWSEVGKVSDPQKVANSYRNELARMSKEERLAKLQADLGDLLDE